MSEPLDPAYGRATNTERYGVLHAAARELLAELEQRYDVEPHPDPAVVIRDLCPTIPFLNGEAAGLVPELGGPLVIGFTDFPGLVVVRGRWHRVVYPYCGCDGCDEDPLGLIADVRASVEELVGGNVAEELDDHRYRWLTTSSTSALSRSTDDGMPRGAPARLDWSPWPSR